MKTKLIFTAITLLVAMTSAQAYDTDKVYIDGLYYYLDSSTKTAEVTNYQGNDLNESYVSGDLLIPEMVAYNSNTYSVTSIGRSAFYYCSGLISVMIPNSVTNIGEQAFYLCSGLTSVTIPDNVTSIGTNAFLCCYSLTSVMIPNSVTSIAQNAFSEVPNIVYSGSATGAPWGARSMNGYVDGYLVYSDNTKTTLLACSAAAIGEITIPNSVTSIGNKAFYYCSSLTTITIPNSVTSIGYSAFLGCSGLTGVTIPNSVISIGNRAFGWCRGLTSFTIPNNVIRIEDETFIGCNRLKRITIGNSVAIIYSTAFKDCDGLIAVHISDIAVWCNIAHYDFGLLYYAGNLYLNDNLVTEMTIPESVTTIKKYAFKYCNSLTNVTIGNSVTSIGEDAFSHCKSLTSVTISNGVGRIEKGAFSYCSSLNSVTIPNSVTSIESKTFSSCYNLRNVTIPNSVTSIGNWAFESCYGLNTIYNYAKTPQEINSNVFYSVNTARCTLYVPAQSIELYRTADVWKDFMIEPIPDTEEPEGEQTECNVYYQNKVGEIISSENITLTLPIAPVIDGFTFLEWRVIEGSLNDGIYIQAVYTANTPTIDTYEEITNPSNPAQKLIRNGNVYILHDGHTYTMTGAEVK